MYLRCLLHHILSLIAYTFRCYVFIIIVQFMMNSNSRIRFGLQIVFDCLYITPSNYHHCANLSGDIELIKCLSDIFCRVCEQDWAYSLSYPSYNIWDWVFSVYPPLVMIERIYTLSYNHHQIGNMNYYPLFEVRSWNNRIRCMSLYILITIDMQNKKGSIFYWICRWRYDDMIQSCISQNYSYIEGM